jgi:hypothetical protein
MPPEAAHAAPVERVRKRLETPRVAEFRPIRRNLRFVLLTEIRRQVETVFLAPQMGLELIAHGLTGDAVNRLDRIGTWGPRNRWQFQ